MKLPQILYKMFVILLACVLGTLGGLFAAGFCKGIEDEQTFCFSLVIVGIAAGVSLSYLLCYGLSKIADKK